MFDASGGVRSLYQEFGSFLNNIEFENLNQMKDFSNQFFRNQGVTFTVYSDNKGVERIFPFDVIPRIIGIKEWTFIEKGIVQRIRALNLFLRDVYHEQFIIKDKIIPPQLVINNRYFIREMINLSVPKNVYTHISGVDLIRDKSGDFHVTLKCCTSS